MSRLLKFCRVYKTNIIHHLYRRLFWDNDWDTLPFLQGLSTSSNRKLKKAERRIFTFWTGENPMSENRKRALFSLQKCANIPLVFVTPNNLSDFILRDHPLPEEFKYLSNVHKSDYLRAYFMYYYGGGYCDIKPITKPWDQSFDLLNANDNKSGIGYTELSNGVGYLQSDQEFPLVKIYNLSYIMHCQYKQLIGNCAYIFKPGSLIFEKLLEEQERRMRQLREQLIKYPGNVLGDNEGYPVRWTYLLGEIFHPLVFRLRNDLLIDDSIRPTFSSYK